MGSIINDLHISLRAGGFNSRTDNSSLPTLIQRINLERGSFRDISEESLRQEIAENEAGISNEVDDAMEVEDREEGKLDKIKDIAIARDEILGQIEQAHMSALFSLEFVSLLLSKDTPVQAGLSISPALREAVGLGTLGADKIHNSRVTEAQVQDDKRIAKGWKTRNLDKTVDSILESASKLEKEIAVETKYWEQVLAVSEKGWAVCRLPHERYTLGVRFGFSEATPIFTNRSLAALRRGEDGSISLDLNSAAQPKALRVRIETDGIHTGEAQLPTLVLESAPVQDIILQARNTIFSEELWQELNREARTLASYGVRAKGHTISCPISANQKAIFELTTLEEAEPSQKGNDAGTAEAIYLTLHLLLCYAHRQNYRRRSQPPPPLTSGKRPTPPYALLRALITRIQYHNIIISLNQLLQTLCSAVLSAMGGLNPAPSFSLTSISHPQIAATGTDITNSEITILSLIDRLQATTILTLTPTTTLTILSKTTMYRTETLHNITLSPQESPLHELCPIPQILNDLESVKAYILFAASCAFASMFAAETAAPTNLSGSNSGVAQSHSSPNIKDQDDWHLSSQPNILRKSFSNHGRSKQLLFEMRDVQLKEGMQASLMLRVKWEWVGAEGSKITDLMTSQDEEDIKPKGRGEGAYEWFSSDAEDYVRSMWHRGAGEPIRALSDVVREAGTWLDK